MKLRCLDECRVLHEGKVYRFEETTLFGYIYEVDDELGKKAIATGKCQQIIEDEEHPYTGPATSSPSIIPHALPETETSPTAVPLGRRRRPTEPE